MKKKAKRVVAAGMSLAMGTIIMTSDVMVSPVMASQINGENPYATELYASNELSYNGFRYSVSGSNATITGYDGESTDVVIPEQIGNYKVTAIGNSAFKSNNKITSVKIPATVTRIGGFLYSTGAFQSCTNLKTVIIEEGKEKAGIDCWAFKDCTSLKEITIPGNYSYIDQSAFENCKALKKVTYSDSVNDISHYIGISTFKGCQSLTQVILGSGLWKIDKEAFCNDSMLGTINIPDGVKSIGGTAFLNCTRLSEVTLPEGLTTIEIQAFGGCKSLKSVIIPSTVKTINSYVFSGCSSLSSVIIKEGTQEATIERECFENCKSLTSIEIPGNYSSIGISAFSGCISLKSVKYAASVNNIKHKILDWAFSSCTSLTNVVLEEGLTRISRDAFRNTNIEKLNLPEGLNYIEESAFEGCKNLTYVSIPSTMENIYGYYGRGTFQNCEKLTEVNIVGSDNIDAEIGGYAFSNCTSLKNIVIPGNYRKIGERAFSGCLNLTSFEYKKSQYDYPNQNIGQNVFNGCTLLKDVKLPNTLETIGDYAFYNCSSLLQFKIPEGVKTIGGYAFSGCKMLDTVSIPSTTESIGASCFRSCSALKNVIIAKGDMDAKINYEAFKYCTSLTDISIPGNYVSIAGSVFTNCTNLTRFSWEKGNYGYNNQTLGESVFSENGKLSVVSLPSTLGTIDEKAFYNVKSTFVIEGEAGSKAESYAKTKGITFKSYSQPLSINAVISPSGSAKDGDVINIQANASGGSSDYQYKLVVYNEDTGKWGVVRDYGETSGFTWVSSPGSRRFYVKVKDSTGKEVLSSALISINKKLEAKASYKYVNNNIEFTASGNNGSGNYQYKFIVYNVDTGKWGIVQDYSSKNTCVWNASGASAGNRKFYVDIKDSNGTVVRSVAMNVSTQTGLNVSLKSSSAQVNPGASVKLTANAAGGNGSYQYKFIVYNTATKQWGKVQDYSSSNTCTWVAGAAGTRQFYVDVKDASGKVVRSAVNTINVGNGMSVTATISTNANKVGGKVTISGAATGGAGSYQYKFIVYNKTTKTWGLVQNFSTNNKITWTAGSAGDREFYIDVKDANGNVVRSSVMNVKTTN